MLYLSITTIDRPEARKRTKEMGRICETEAGQMGADAKLFFMLRHFTEDDFIRRFTFADETSGKPIIPRLKNEMNLASMLLSIKEKRLSFLLDGKQTWKSWL